MTNSLLPRRHGLLMAATMLVLRMQSFSMAFTPLFSSRSPAGATATATVLYNSPAEKKSVEATKLLEKAAQLRAEIATMESKTIAQVEQEAQQKRNDARMRQEAVDAKRREQQLNPATTRTTNDGRYIQVPSTTDEMVRQAARSVELAFQDGITRQTVRFALIREDQTVNEINQWPGGAQEISRTSAKPLTRALLRQIHAPTKQQGEQQKQQSGALKLPPTIKEQDIWDFDGSALITAESQAGANADVQAMVLPNTDNKYTNDIAMIDKAMGERLFLLVNPFWRNLDSWGINLLAPNAKKIAKHIIFDRGYNETYSLLRFSCRGEECVALKAYPYDWQLFAYREDDNSYIGGRAVQTETAIRLGSCKEEPSTSLITQLLNERPEFKLTRTMRQFRK